MTIIPETVNKAAYAINQRSMCLILFSPQYSDPTTPTTVRRDVLHYICGDAMQSVERWSLEFLSQMPPAPAQWAQPIWRAAKLSHHGAAASTPSLMFKPGYEPEVVVASANSNSSHRHPSWTVLYFIQQYWLKPTLTSPPASSPPLYFFNLTNIEWLSSPTVSTVVGMKTVLQDKKQKIIGEAQIEQLIEVFDEPELQLDKTKLEEWLAIKKQAIGDALVTKDLRLWISSHWGGMGPSLLDDIDVHFVRISYATGTNRPEVRAFRADLPGGPLLDVQDIEYGIVPAAVVPAVTIAPLPDWWWNRVMNFISKLWTPLTGIGKKRKRDPTTNSALRHSIRSHPHTQQRALFLPPSTTESSMLCLLASHGTPPTASPATTTINLAPGSAFDMFVRTVPAGRLEILVQQQQTDMDAAGSTTVQGQLNKQSDLALWFSLLCTTTAAPSSSSTLSLSLSVTYGEQEPVTVSAATFSARLALNNAAATVLSFAQGADQPIYGNSMLALRFDQAQPPMRLTVADLVGVLGWKVSPAVLLFLQLLSSSDLTVAADQTSLLFAPADDMLTRLNLAIQPSDIPSTCAALLGSLGLDTTVWQIDTIVLRAGRELRRVGRQTTVVTRLRTDLCLHVRLLLLQPKQQTDGKEGSDALTGFDVYFDIQQDTITLTLDMLSPDTVEEATEAILKELASHSDIGAGAVSALKGMLDKLGKLLSGGFDFPKAVFIKRLQVAVTLPTPSSSTVLSSIESKSLSLQSSPSLMSVPTVTRVSAGASSLRLSSFSVYNRLTLSPSFDFAFSFCYSAQAQWVDLQLLSAVTATFYPYDLFVPMPPDVWHAELGQGDGEDTSDTPSGLMPDTGPPPPGALSGLDPGMPPSALFAGLGFSDIHLHADFGSTSSSFAASVSLTSALELFDGALVIDNISGDITKGGGSLAMDFSCTAALGDSTVLVSFGYARDTSSDSEQMPQLLDPLIGQAEAREALQHNGTVTQWPIALSDTSTSWHLTLTTDQIDLTHIIGLLGPAGQSVSSFLPLMTICDLLLSVEVDSVAVGPNDRITRPDGSTLTRQSASPTISFSGVLYIGELACAVEYSAGLLTISLTSTAGPMSLPALLSSFLPFLDGNPLLATLSALPIPFVGVLELTYDFTSSSLSLLVGEASDKPQFLSLYRWQRDKGGQAAATPPTPSLSLSSSSEPATASAGGGVVTLVVCDVQVPYVTNATLSLPVVGEVQSPFQQFLFCWNSDALLEPDLAAARRIGVAHAAIKTAKRLSMRPVTKAGLDDIDSKEAVEDMEVYAVGDAPSFTFPLPDAVTSLVEGSHFIAFIVVGSSFRRSLQYDFAGNQDTGGKKPQPRSSLRVKRRRVHARCQPPRVGMNGQHTNINDPQDDTAPAGSSPAFTSAQTRLGPLTVDKIGLSYADGCITLLFTGSVALGPIVIELLGLRVSVKVGDGAPSFGLSGLGVSFEAGPLSVAGEFSHDDLRPEDKKIVEYRYTGGVSVRFQPYTITCVGSYSRLTSGGVSFFIYGKLTAPLGGVPAAFVTGLSLGFGYNSEVRVPLIGEVFTFPFLADPSMSASTPPLAILDQLRNAPQPWVREAPGSYWLLLGVQLTSFELLQSSGLLLVEFGAASLSFTLLLRGQISMPQQAPTAECFVFLDLAMEVSVQPSRGFWTVQAELSTSSFVLSSLCHLSGGFAAASWFDPSDHAGDYVVTVGGYCTKFDWKVPAWYPAVQRVAYGWSVSSALSISGECYFALVPAGCMGGGSLASVYDLSFVKAWFTAVADFIIYWHPFSYEGDFDITMGVTAHINLLLFTIDINVELSASVHLYGPPLGGSVTVDLSIFSFTIDFGAEQQTLPRSWQYLIDMLPHSRTTPSSARIGGHKKSRERITDDSSNGDSDADAELDTADTSHDVGDDPNPNLSITWNKIVCEQGLQYEVPDVDDMRNVRGTVWAVRGAPFRFHVESPVPIWLFNYYCAGPQASQTLHTTQTDGSLNGSRVTGVAQEQLYNSHQEKYDTNVKPCQFTVQHTMDVHVRFVDQDRFLNIAMCVCLQPSAVPTTNKTLSTKMERISQSEKSNNTSEVLRDINNNDNGDGNNHDGSSSGDNRVLVSSSLLENEHNSPVIPDNGPMIRGQLPPALWGAYRKDQPADSSDLNLALVSSVTGACLCAGTSVATAVLPEVRLSDFQYAELVPCATAVWTLDSDGAFDPVQKQRCWALSDGPVQQVPVDKRDSALVDELLTAMADEGGRQQQDRQALCELITATGLWELTNDELPAATLGDNALLLMKWELTEAPCGTLSMQTAAPTLLAAPHVSTTAMAAMLDNNLTTSTSATVAADFSPAGHHTTPHILPVPTTASQSTELQHWVTAAPLATSSVLGHLAQRSGADGTTPISTVESDDGRLTLTASAFSTTLPLDREEWFYLYSASNDQLVLTATVDAAASHLTSAGSSSYQLSFSAPVSSSPAASQLWRRVKPGDVCLVSTTVRYAPLIDDGQQGDSAAGQPDSFMLLNREAQSVLGLSTPTALPAALAPSTASVSRSAVNEASGSGALCLLPLLDDHCVSVQESSQTALTFVGQLLAPTTNSSQFQLVAAVAGQSLMLTCDGGAASVQAARASPDSSQTFCWELCADWQYAVCALPAPLSSPRSSSSSLASVFASVATDGCHVLMPVSVFGSSIKLWSFGVLDGGRRCVEVDVGVSEAGLRDTPFMHVRLHVLSSTVWVLTFQRPLMPLSYLVQFVASVDAGKSWSDVTFLRVGGQSLRSNAPLQMAVVGGHTAVLALQDEPARTCLVYTAAFSSIAGGQPRDCSAWDWQPASVYNTPLTVTEQGGPVLCLRPARGGAVGQAEQLYLMAQSAADNLLYITSTIDGVSWQPMTALICAPTLPALPLRCQPSLCVHLDRLYAALSSDPATGGMQLLWRPVDAQPDANTWQQAAITLPLATQPTLSVPPDWACSAGLLSVGGTLYLCDSLSGRVRMGALYDRLQAPLLCRSAEQTVSLSLSSGLTSALTALVWAAPTLTPVTGMDPSDPFSTAQLTSLLWKTATVQGGATNQPMVVDNDNRAASSSGRYQLVLAASLAGGGQTRGSTAAALRSAPQGSATTRKAGTASGDGVMHGGTVWSAVESTAQPIQTGCVYRVLLSADGSSLSITQTLARGKLTEIVLLAADEDVGQSPQSSSSAASVVLPTKLALQYDGALLCLLPALRPGVGYMLSVAPLSYSLCWQTESSASSSEPFMAKGAEVTLAVQEASTTLPFDADGSNCLNASWTTHPTTNQVVLEVSADAKASER